MDILLQSQESRDVLAPSCSAWLQPINACSCSKAWQKCRIKLCKFLDYTFWVLITFLVWFPFCWVLALRAMLYQGVVFHSTTPFLHFILSKISTCMVLAMLGEWHTLENEVTLVSGGPQFLVHPAQQWSGSSQMTITRLNTNGRAEFSSTTSTLLSWTAGVWCLDLSMAAKDGWASHKRVGTTRSIPWTWFPGVLEQG